MSMSYRREAGTRRTTQTLLDRIVKFRPNSIYTLCHVLNELAFVQFIYPNSKKGWSTRSCELTNLVARIAASTPTMTNIDKSIHKLRR